MDLIISSATQRSGSTLLQRIFNARKETLIWGEHLGCLTDFYKIYDKVNTFSIRSTEIRKRFFESGENQNQSLAMMTPSGNFVDQAITKAVITFFDTLYESKDHDIIGFKEVQYGRRELMLFRKCFPNAAIILLVRNPIMSWKSLKNSKWNKNSINRHIAKWNNNVSFYLQFSKEDPNAHLIKYEDIVKKDSNTMNLISELGKLTIEEINNVLSHKIGSSGNRGTITAEHVFLIKRKCSKNMQLLSYQ